MTNKTKENQGYLLGFAWIGLDLAWTNLAAVPFACGAPRPLAGKAAERAQIHETPIPLRPSR
jgi:hypothetical protein